MRAFNQEAYDRVISAADKKYRFDAERREQYIATMMEKNCPFKISMLLHSMGNYLFKHLLLSSIYHARDLVFDNVILASADANNEAHRKWVDQIQCRNRVYITINEDDSALKAARMKLGSKQRARLGHYVSRLDSDHAVYVDFTDMKGVGKSHAYFEGKALGNTKIQEFFRAAIHGDRAEKKLKFDASMNLYRI
jgi:esterase/lipase superfamily enzyme